MAAQLIHMKCQNCGANLDLDLNHLIAFCPYCGEKLLLDVEKLNEVLVAKEETKRKEMEYSRDVETKRLEHDKEIEMKKIDHEKQKDENKLQIILFVLLLFLVFCMMFGDKFGLY